MQRESNTAYLETQNDQVGTSFPKHDATHAAVAHQTAPSGRTNWRVPVHKDPITPTKLIAAWPKLQSLCPMSRGCHMLPHIKARGMGNGNATVRQVAAVQSHLSEIHQVSPRYPQRYNGQHVFYAESPKYCGAPGASHEQATVVGRALGIGLAGHRPYCICNLCYGLWR